MPRPPKWRRVEIEPQFTYFKPAGIPKRALEEIVLNVEEIEAIRLKDREGLEQEECALKMNISRPTFQRILIGARSKLAEAIIEGKAIKIEGGNYRLANKLLKCPICEHKFDFSPSSEDDQKEISCPHCGKKT